MKKIKTTNWIWQNSAPKADEHVEFFAKFNVDEIDGAVLRVSADSDYGVYINGTLVEFGQYADYPHYKVYDEFDVSKYLVKGENTLAFEVWYYGINDAMTYIFSDAGLWFELIGDKGVIYSSGDKVLARQSKTYKSHVEKRITYQLGLTYFYDATCEDEWKTKGGADFLESVKVKGAEECVLRPVKKLITREPEVGKVVKSEKGRILFDFGRETVGIFRLKFNSKTEQTVKLCYGEHIEDGWVRDIIAQRDFSILYRAKQGENDFLGYFVRLGLRYAEVRFDGELENVSVEILPREYPVQEIKYECKDKSLQAIYDVCVRTLTLCMHEHYEDCPWREQALYAMDSRNQMLCGYYAFREFDFPRACLNLIAEDRRADNLVSICSPSGVDLVIPSFSLHYFTGVAEYGDYSGDWAFVEGILPKLKKIMDVFLSRQRADGLVQTFEGKEYWNFYEWADGLSSEPYLSEPTKLDFLLNGFLSLALQKMAHICDKLGVENDYLARAEKINLALHKEFFDGQEGAYYVSKTDNSFAELVNGVAVLCGVAKGEIAQKICERLANDDNSWTKATLSMKCFKYDALLLCDTEKYKDYVLEDIRKVYNKMLNCGATSVWETELGEKDFDGAGSLCHGWSALPVYYFHLLKA